MYANGVVTEAASQQPVTKSLLKLPQRTTSEIPDCPGAYEYLFQCHGNLLSPFHSTEKLKVVIAGFMCRNFAAELERNGEDCEESNGRLT
jgi:hypothetical protein